MESIEELVTIGPPALVKVRSFCHKTVVCCGCGAIWFCRQTRFEVFDRKMASLFYLCYGCFSLHKATAMPKSAVFLERPKIFAMASKNQFSDVCPFFGTR